MDCYTIEDLYQYIKKYCLHSALAFVGDIGAKLLKRDDPKILSLCPQVINEWQLAFIAKALILNSNDYKSKSLDIKGLLKCANIYNNLGDKFLKVSREDDDKFQKAGQSFLIRTAYQQFYLQRKINYLIPRALFLFEEIPSKISDPNFEVDKEIKDIYNLSVKEVIMIGFTIFATTKRGYFYPDYLINFNDKDLKKFITKETLGNLIDRLSADYPKLREAFNYYKGEEELDPFGFNALRMYPIVKTEVAGLVVPVPRFLLERITTGLYYSLMDKYKNYSSNIFMEFFGKEIFERYVGLLLEQEYKINKLLFKEWSYRKGRNECLTSDWIVVKDNKAILIECKTSGISMEAKSYAELEKIKDDLKLRVVKAIEQMVSLVNDVKRKCKDLERLYSIKKFYYVIVTYDKIYLSSSFIIKDMIKKELIQKGIKKIPKYEVLSIDELEDLIPYLKDFNLDFLLDNKFRNKKWAQYDFNEFMYYFLTENSLDIKKENEMLRNKSDKFFEGISPRLKSIKKLS